MRAHIIDYGSGNLRSAAKALERMAPTGMDITVSPDAEDVRRADYLVLPGVGAFGDCRKGLEKLPDMLDTLEEEVIRGGKPFLGICVGMQLTAERGLEHGENPGFGWLPGVVTPLQPADPVLKIPHMGWNTLNRTVTGMKHPVLKDMEDNRSHAYFVHSFHMTPLAAETEALPSWILARTDYGQPVTAIVGRDNVIGTQFHPEKSQETGLRLLQNFLEWRP